MELGLIDSAWFATPVDRLEGIRKTREIGFDSIDIFADPLDLDPVERKSIRLEAERAHLPIRSIACVAPGIIDINPSVQRFNRDRVARHLDLAYEYDARNVLLVLGEYIWQQEVIRPEDQWAWAVAALKWLGDYADHLGVDVAMELEPFHYSLINTVDKMVRFLDDVDHPRVRANMDVSHLHLTDPKTPPSAIHKLKGRIAHVHFSDNNGKVHGDLPPGKGTAPLADYLKELKAAGYDGTVSIELEYSPEPARIVEWVTDAYRTSDALMRGIGARTARRQPA